MQPARHAEGLKRGEGGRETEKVKPVPRDHIRKVRPHLSRPARALVALQLLTGARADELVRIRATDFDRSRAVWTVTYDGSTDDQSHKTAHHGKERVLYFGPRAQRIVRLFMRPGRSLDMPLFSPREGNAEMKRRKAKGSRRANQKPSPVKSEHRWKNRHAEGKADEPRSIGDAYTTASYRRAIHRACEKAFPTPAKLNKGDDQETWRKAHRWGPHRLRHNAATFLRREFGIEVASIILGHSSLAITQTYAEQDEKKAREVIAKVG
ncbi:MAG: site-specific integrase [Phycisphaeraceae bacterium]